MKYTREIEEELTKLYQAGTSVDDLAAKFDVPQRSVIAKLSSLGVYKRKEYLNKRGEVPVKKEEYIERIAELLHVNLDLLESLEKANKSVLILLEKALKKDE